MEDFEMVKMFCVLFPIFYFRKLRETVGEKIMKKIGKKWVGRVRIRCMDEVKTDIGELLTFIRMNSLITVFSDEYYDGGPLTNLLNFAEENFGLDQMEFWLNLYETKNPLLAMLERPNLKKITLAKFLKEIKIWDRDSNGHPAINKAGMQSKRNLNGIF